MTDLEKRNAERLLGVNAALVNVVIRTLGRLPFPVIVVEGVRSKARQADLYAQGRTKPGKIVTWTLNSKHIDGRAVDLAPFKDGVIAWGDSKGFDAIRLAMLASAAELGVNIRCGADWDMDGIPHEKGESDSPHAELL